MTGTDIRWGPMEPRTLTRCRVTVNMVGARAGDEVLVDLTAPGMDDLMDEGYLVPLEAPPAAAEAPAVEAPVSAQEPPGDDETPEAAQPASDLPVAS